MRFNVITAFPDLFTSFLRGGLFGKAVENGIIQVRIIDIREFATDRHRTVDDYPYGGGAGMVLKPEPIVRAVRSLDNPGKRLLLGPAGVPFRQAHARRLAEQEVLTLICGHYEDVDERVRELVVDEEFSIGDFVLSGGEIAAMAIMDATGRLLPGFMGNPGSLDSESFTGRLLDYPHYTRPRVFEGLEVPEILLSGDHEKIRRWRMAKQILRTLSIRPDLLDSSELSHDEKKLIFEFTGEKVE